MTYLGKGRRGRGGGGHICFWQPFSWFPHSIPNVSHSTSVFPHCTGGMWGTNPLQSTPLNPSLWRKRIHLSRPSSHLSHPALLTNPVCAHRHVAFGTGWSPEYGPSAKDPVHVSVNLSHSTAHMQYGNMCVGVISRSFVQTGSRQIECWCFFWAVSMRTSCSDSLSVSGFVAPLVDKRACAAVPQDTERIWICNIYAVICNVCYIQQNRCL